MAKYKDEYEVIDYRTGSVCVYYSEERAKKEQNRLLNKNKEIAIIEQICLPSLIVWMFTINEKNKPDRVTVNRPIKESLEKFVEDISGFEGKEKQKIRYKRLNKLIDKVVKWAVKNKFDTRKVTLMTIELMCALNEAGYVEYSEDVIKTVIEMKGHIESAKDDISGFDKLEASVVKKAPKLLNIVQEMGYFQY